MKSKQQVYWTQIFQSLKQNYCIGKVEQATRNFSLVEINLLRPEVITAFNLLRNLDICYACNIHIYAIGLPQYLLKKGIV